MAKRRRGTSFSTAEEPLENTMYRGHFGDFMNETTRLVRKVKRLLVTRAPAQLNKKRCRAKLIDAKFRTQGNKLP
jgi:hypothetical protein